MEYYKNLDLKDIVYFCEFDLIEKTEQWRDIVSYDKHYKVSDLGRVKSLTRKYFSVKNNSYSEKKESILKQRTDKYGYAEVGLCINGKKKTKKVHRLVINAFILNPENKPFTNHKNSIRNNNMVMNLEWCTQKENIIHSFQFGLNLKGEQRYNSKLTEKDVLEIRNIGHKESLRKLSFATESDTTIILVGFTVFVQVVAT